MTTRKATKFTELKRGVTKSVRSAKITKSRLKNVGFYCGVPHFGHSSDEEDLASSIRATLTSEDAGVNDFEEAAQAMAEPRARSARQKGQLNFEAELKQLLYAFGDDINPLPETVRVLDEIVTDFIIEICHEAARAASYAGRQKVKVEDFMFAIRKNPIFLGRVQELMDMEKELKEARKQFDVPEGKAGLEKGKPKEGSGKGKGKATKNVDADENGDEWEDEDE